MKRLIYRGPCERPPCWAVRGKACQHKWASVYFTAYLDLKSWEELGVVLDPMVVVLVVSVMVGWIPDGWG